MKKQARRARLIITTAVLFSVAFAVYYNRQISYTFLYALIFFLIISIISIVAAAKNVSVEQRVSGKRVIAGDTVEIAMSVENTGIFPYYGARVGFVASDGLEYSTQDAQDPVIRPKTKHESSCFLHFPYRGVYTAGVGSIRYSDYLGIFRRRVCIPDEELPRIIVYPHVYETFTMPLRKTARYDEAQKSDYRAEPNFEIRELRKFVPEDDYRRIHWKISAKRGEPVVKEFETDSCEFALHIIDAVDFGLAGEARAQLEDRIVSAAASAVNFCVRSDVLSQIVCGDGEDKYLSVGTGTVLYDTLEFLAALNFNEKAPVLSQKKLFSIITSSSIDIMVYTARLDATSLFALTQMRRIGCNVTLFLFTTKQQHYVAELSSMLDELIALGTGVCIDGRWVSE